MKRKKQISKFKENKRAYRSSTIESLSVSGKQGCLRLLSTKKSKYILKEYYSKENKNFESALEIFRQINHPSIIKCFGCSCTCIKKQKHSVNSCSTLILEYGGPNDLCSYIMQNHYISESKILSLFLNLLYGIKYLHDKKIVHLDIKPENIMIKNLENEIIKLIDFGSGSIITDTPSTYIDVPFTPCYGSPERYKRETYDPFAADIWSLGCILYVMITYSMYDTTFDLVKAIKNNKLYFQEDVSDNIKDIIYNCCCIDPKKRLTIDSLITEVRKAKKSINRIQLIDGDVKKLIDTGVKNIRLE